MLMLLTHKSRRRAKKEKRWAMPRWMLLVWNNQTVNEMEVVMQPYVEILLEVMMMKGEKALVREVEEGKQKQEEVVVAEELVREERLEVNKVEVVMQLYVEMDPPTFGAGFHQTLTSASIFIHRKERAGWDHV